MSEADRYFIKKGFSKVIKQGIEEFTDDDGNYIHFDLVIERFTCNCYLSAKELQAINKKVEELRMDMSNKTSDENVVNDIKILNKFCKYEDAVVLTEDALEEVQDALQNILAEREQKDKRIQELEEENSKTQIMSPYYVKENYIPKQKIKDKIEELKQDKESKYYDSFLEERDIEKTIEFLQELLQEEAKNEL